MFIRVSAGSIWSARCRRVPSGSRGFTRARIVVVGFIRVHVGSLTRSIKLACIHSDTDRSHRGFVRVTGAPFCVAGFTGFRVGSHGRALESSGSLGFARVHLGAPWGHSDPRGFFHARPRVAGFIGVLVG